MKTGSAPRVSSFTRFSLAAIALASLALAPQCALAQHGHPTSGHSGGGHTGGGHPAGGFGGSHSAPASHPQNTTHPVSTARVTTPPVHPVATTSTGTTTTSGENARNTVIGSSTSSARPSFGSSVSTLSSSGVPAGLAQFAEPGATGASNSARARSSVTLGFPVSGSTNWQPSTGQARVMSLSGQGRTLWQNSSGAMTAGVPARSFGSTDRSLIVSGPSHVGPRHFRNRFPIFGPGFGFFGPFGFFGFNDGFGLGFGGGFGNGFGCDPFWDWGCGNLGWGNGWGTGWGAGYGNGLNMYYPAGGYSVQADEQSDTARIYGPYAWQNPPASGANAQSSVTVSEPPTLIYLKDGTSYGVTNYWLADSKLHYVTSYGGENAIEVNQLDFQRTVDENAQRGVAFTLKPAPGAPMQSVTPDAAGSPAQNAPPDSAAPLTPPAGTP